MSDLVERNKDYAFRLMVAVAVFGYEWHPVPEGAAKMTSATEWLHAPETEGGILSQIYAERKMDGTIVYPKGLRPWHRKIDAAWEVVGAMVARGFQWQASQDEYGVEHFAFSKSGFKFTSSSRETIAQAICVAALDAMSWERDHS